MKTSLSLQLAVAAGFISMASVVSAQTLCAIQCFQGVITDHPPLDCKEENMYLCFCKDQSLQNYFIDCVYNDCASDAEASVQFGVQVCAGYGVDITSPERGQKTTAAQPEPTTSEAQIQTSAQEIPIERKTPTEPAASETPIANPTTGQPSAVEPISSSHSTVMVPIPSSTARLETPTPSIVQVNMGITHKASRVVMIAGALVAGLIIM